MTRIARNRVSNFNETLQKVEARMALWRRGCVFFGNDFIDLGTRETIKDVLDSMVDNGVIYRVRENMYCYPVKLDSVLKRGGAVPTLDDIANAIEKRNGLLMKMSEERVLKKQLTN